MRSSRVVRASDSQCRGRSYHGFDPSISLRHSRISVAADESVYIAWSTKKQVFTEVFMKPCFRHHARILIHKWIGQGSPFQCETFYTTMCRKKLQVPEVRSFTLPRAKFRLKLRGSFADKQFSLRKQGSLWIHACCKCERVYRILYFFGPKWHSPITARCHSQGRKSLDFHGPTPSLLPS